MHETLRNTSALGVIGKIGEVHAKGDYDAMKDVVVITSTKIGERKNYITKKVADVARALGTAKKVTYDATIAKAKELGAIASQKAKENVNVVAETSEKTYKVTTHNNKVA